MIRIAEARIRGILDSRGRVTVEADVALIGGAEGRGSAPVAIAPGRHEKARSTSLRIGPSAGLAAASELCRAFERMSFSDELGFDHEIARRARNSGLQADVTLALSQALWRAASRERGEPLMVSLSKAAGTTPATPCPIVNAFSGGIHHAEGKPISFQQIMLVAEGNSLTAEIGAVLEVFGKLEERRRQQTAIPALSASSGLLADAPPEDLLDELASLFEGDSVRLGAGIDVAAEHLLEATGRYRVGDRTLDSSALLDYILELAERFGLLYIEDPFDAEHPKAWRDLLARLPAETLLVGDDLFASDAARLDRDLARGVLLKPSQIGTVSATLQTARSALEADFELCVSHRSGETEDTFICDLATALGARFQKVGGPRRGDRIAKYNQLLRLAEEVPDRAWPASLQKSPDHPQPNQERPTRCLSAHN